MSLPTIVGGLLFFPLLFGGFGAVAVAIRNKRITIREILLGVKIIQPIRYRTRRDLYTAFLFH